MEYVPVAGDEAATLLGSLERQRATLAWKCGGLDAAGLRATVGASSITLGGLLKHLALVEDDYFTGKLLGRTLGTPWDTVDWDADPDWEWRSAAGDSPEELMTMWRGAVERSRAAVTEALADGDLGQPLHSMDQQVLQRSDVRVFATDAHFGAALSIRRLFALVTKHACCSH
jgi:hypothetical protein